MKDHPLDRTVWHALASRHAAFAIGSGAARRYPPDMAPFASPGDAGADGLAALVDLTMPGESIALFEAGMPPDVPGFRTTLARPCLQLVWTGEGRSPAPVEPVALGEADVPEMLALTALTRPGPFLARTWQMGGFVGVRRAGALVAMAGERLTLPGFTEVSGVCTHPDHRGQGLAAALIADRARGIAARGDVPFLHSYAENAGAIALYERLGFRGRAEVMLYGLERNGVA